MVRVSRLRDRIWIMASSSSGKNMLMWGIWPNTSKHRLNYVMAVSRCVMCVKVLLMEPLCCRNPLYNNPAAKDCVEAFLTHAVRPLTMLIQITGHNRARQRDKWARLLEELAALQDEVEQQWCFLQLQHLMMFQFCVKCHFRWYCDTVDQVRVTECIQPHTQTCSDIYLPIPGPGQTRRILEQLQTRKLTLLYDLVGSSMPLDQSSWSHARRI